MAENKKDENGAAGALIFIILIAVAIYIIFRCSKLVFSYSRSLLLSIWTFLVLSSLVVISIRYYNMVDWLESQNEFDAASKILFLFWVSGVGSIILSTFAIYKKNKKEIDILIQEESDIEHEVSKGKGSSMKLLTGAGALYAGYSLGKKTEL
jgi:hypothetical protein